MALIPWKTKRREDTGVSTAGGFRSEMDRLFDSFLRDVGGWADRWEIFGGSLPLDVEETDKEVLVRAEIPGVTAEDLELSIRGDSLVIAGEKKERETRPEKGFVYQERRFGSFRRQISLPCAVEENDVQAEYKDGVLSVRLKKSQETLPKRIAVRNG
jgi:HSP20 family protein